MFVVLGLLVFPKDLPEVALAARPAVTAPPLEVDALGTLELVEFDVAGDHAIAGAAVRELGLPRSALVALVARRVTRSRHVEAPSSSQATGSSCSHPARLGPSSRTSLRVGAGGSSYAKQASISDAYVSRSQTSSALPDRRDDIVCPSSPTSPARVLSKAVDASSPLPRKRIARFEPWRTE
jgi:hypothetical protein